MGRTMILRVGICSVAYALVWGIYVAVKQTVLEGSPPQTFEYLYVAPPLVALGGAVCWGSLDLSYGTGLLHFGFYLFVTIALRKVVGLPIL